MNRRHFLKKAGFTIASLQAIQVLQVSVASAQSAEGIVGDDLVIKSGPSRFAPAATHIHDLTIPLADFQNPPAEGVSLKTSYAFLHRHTVKISRDQLLAIGQGQSIAIPDTVNDHIYTIALPRT